MVDFDTSSVKFDVIPDDFAKQCKRVLKVTKKPTKDEYFNFSKVTALGIVVIGIVGFVITLICQIIGI